MPGPQGVENIDVAVRLYVAAGSRAEDPQFADAVLVADRCEARVIDLYTWRDHHAPGYRQNTPIAGSAHTRPDGGVLTGPAAFPSDPTMVPVPHRASCLLSDCASCCRTGLNSVVLAHNPEVAGSNPAPATRKCRSEA